MGGVSFSDLGRARSGLSLISISNLSIFGKVLVLVAASSLAMMVVAGAGYWGINSLAHAMNEIESSGQEAVSASRVTDLALELSRTEFILSADPTPDNLREMERKLAAQRHELDVALTALQTRFGSLHADLIGNIVKAQKGLNQAQEDTISKVRTLGSKVEVSEEQMIISDAAMTSSTVASKLESAALTLAAAAQDRATQSSAAADQTQTTAKLTMIVVAASGVIGGLVLGVLIAHLGIGRPLTASVDNLERLASGDTNLEIFGLNRRDEIGTIAKALEVFKQKIAENKRMEADAKAAGKLAEQEKIKSMHQLADMLEAAVQGVVESISSAAKDMQSNAQELQTLSEHTLSQATTVVSAADEASTNVENVASAAEQMAATIGTINSRVSEACAVSEQAVGQASYANEVMVGLTRTAEQIGDVVSLISDIAGMTNLLALNATIEAARAGDAGKGFAVVASEVKNLANQTARATDDIRSHVLSVQNMTTDIGQAIVKIVETISLINSLSSEIYAAMDEQGGATRNIAESIDQAAQGTQKVASNIALVSAEAQQVGGASGHVLSASNELTKQADVLRNAVSGFTAKVRSSA